MLKATHLALQPLLHVYNRVGVWELRTVLWKRWAEEE